MAGVIAAGAVDQRAGAGRSTYRGTAIPCTSTLELEGTMKWGDYLDEEHSPITLKSQCSANWDFFSNACHFVRLTTERTLMESGTTLKSIACTYSTCGDKERGREANHRYHMDTMKNPGAGQEIQTTTSFFFQTSCRRFPVDRVSERKMQSQNL